MTTRDPYHGRSPRCPICRRPTTSARCSTSWRGCGCSWSRFATLTRCWCLRCSQIKGPRTGLIRARCAATRATRSMIPLVGWRRSDLDRRDGSSAGLVFSATVCASHTDTRGGSPEQAWEAPRSGFRFIFVIESGGSARRIALRTSAADMGISFPVGT
jgi:hypothetical protein